jgi:hypothetical protein
MKILGGRRSVHEKFPFLEIRFPFLEIRFPFLEISIFGFPFLDRISFFGFPFLEISFFGFPFLDRSSFSGSDLHF